MARWTWDPEKDRRNRAKHGLPLAAGAAVLTTDPNAVSLPDPHPDGDRWRTLGLAHGMVVLFVVHTEPVDGADGRPGRIISVRKASPAERRAYDQRFR